MKDGIYHHVNWPMTVEIMNNQIRRFLTVPPVDYSYWKAVAPAWYQMVQDRRPLSEEEWDYFRLLE